jgi:hypothetical protein
MRQKGGERNKNTVQYMTLEWEYCQKAKEGPQKLEYGWNTMAPKFLQEG